jgi:hypothetical protein
VIPLISPSITPLIRESLAAVSYKPGWLLSVKIDRARGDSVYLQWSFDAPCAKTGDVLPQMGRKWYLSPHMTISELVGTAFKAAIAAEEHECRELFRWNGKRIFNPHISVYALALASEEEDARG